MDDWIINVGVYIVLSFCRFNSIQEAFVELPTVNTASIFNMLPGCQLAQTLLVCNTPEAATCLQRTLPLKKLFGQVRDWVIEVIRVPVTLSDLVTYENLTSILPQDRSVIAQN